MLDFTSAISVLSGVAGIHGWFTGIKQGKLQGQMLDEITKIGAEIERLSDHIFYANSIFQVKDITKTIQQQMLNKRDIRELIEPLQQITGDDILSTAIVSTPEKLQNIFRKSPWELLIEVRPIDRAKRPNNPDLVPIVFIDHNIHYVGWQTRGALPMLFDCEYNPNKNVYIKPSRIYTPRGRVHTPDDSPKLTPSTQREQAPAKHVPYSRKVKTTTASKKKTDFLTKYYAEVGDSRARQKRIILIALAVGLFIITTAIIISLNDSSPVDTEAQRTESIESLERRPTNTSNPKNIVPIGKPVEIFKASTPFRQLRDDPISLSIIAVKGMLSRNGFYHKSWNKDASGFENQFSNVERNGEMLVVDKATKLIWQKSGSSEVKTYSDAEAYISDLNQKEFAGFTDWRLPTLEEAMSLMENEKLNDGLYIDSIFDKFQSHIWTIDTNSLSSQWVLYLNIGQCDFTRHQTANHFVRAVRSGDSE